MAQQAQELTPIADIADVLNSENARRRRSRWLWVLLLVLAVGAIGLWASRQLAPAGPTFESTVVSATDLEITVTSVGTIEPLDEVDVGSELSGVLIEVGAESGETVEAGKVLARLDPALIEAQVEQARAQVKAAEAGLVQLRAAEKLALQTRDTSAELARKGAQPQDASDRAESAYEQAVAGRNAARAQVRASRAALRLAEVNLSKAVIKAPISGVLLSRNAEVGQSVVSTLQAQTLFVIAQDLGNMQVVLDIDEADIARVRNGQAVRFTVAAFPHRTFEGTLMKVSLAPKPMRQVVTYEALVAVDNSDKALVPGMTASATIVAATHADVLAVPNGALRFTPSNVTPEPLEDGVGRLWVEAAEAPPSPVLVEMGATNGRLTIIEGEGLTPGMSVLLSEVRP
ncbi:MAG: efflux RND transporter periplasmic adaptor subunit [Deltaproteobacteria bacterium]|nr:efflux RND transporter periplasmic adaptor subunit [Deltaproteobacteria bacterium]